MSDIASQCINFTVSVSVQFTEFEFLKIYFHNYIVQYIDTVHYSVTTFQFGFDTVFYETVFIQIFRVPHSLTQIVQISFLLIGTQVLPLYGAVDLFFRSGFRESRSVSTRRSQLPHQVQQSSRDRAELSYIIEVVYSSPMLVYLYMYQDRVEYPCRQRKFLVFLDFSIVQMQ